MNLVLEYIYLNFCWLLECFAPPNTWLLDLHWVKIMRNPNFKTLYSKKSYCLTVLENCCVKNHEMIKINFAKKKVLVCLEAP